MYSYAVYSPGKGSAVGKKWVKLELQGTKVGKRGELGSRLAREKGSTTLSPLQTTAWLTSITNFFFFLSFSPNAEPGSGLLYVLLSS